MSIPTPNRRQLLGGLATAVAGHKLASAASGRRAVVAIRLSDIDTREFLVDGSPLLVTSATSRTSMGVHPSLGEVVRLFDTRSMAMLLEPTVGDTDRDYVRPGYSAPSWMMRAVGASPLNSKGKAFGLSSGLLLLTSARSARAETPSTVVFPKTGIGRQLRQAAGLILGGGSQVQLFVASMGGAVTSGLAAAQTAGQLSHLAAAMTAFQRAMDLAGRASDVVVYTDPDRAGVAGRVRLVAGGSVIGGEVYSMSRQVSDRALESWAGFGQETVSGKNQFIY